MVTQTFDPPVINDNYLTYNGSWSTPPQQVYIAVGNYGDIVDRITISATGDLSATTITAKLIYIYLHDSDTDKYSLYKTLAMPATILSDTTPNPELELVFTGGLLLKNSDRILIGASVNFGTNSSYADYLSVTLEGGTYDQQ